MLKEDKKRGRPRKEQEATPPDGHVEELLSQQSELLGKLMAKLNDHDAQFEEMKKNQDWAGKAKLVISEAAYNPTRQQLPGYTVLSYRTVDPFSIATVCAAVLSDDVRTNKISLGEVYMESVERFLRSVKGKTLELAAQHARETEVTKTEGSDYEQADLGKGM